MRSNLDFYLWRLGCFLAVQRSRKSLSGGGGLFPTCIVDPWVSPYKEDGQVQDGIQILKDPRNQFVPDCSRAATPRLFGPYNYINNPELHRAALIECRIALFPWFHTATPGLTRPSSDHPPRVEPELSTTCSADAHYKISNTIAASQRRERCRTTCRLEMKLPPECCGHWERYRRRRTSWSQLGQLMKAAIDGSMTLRV